MISDQCNTFGDSLTCLQISEPSTSGLLQNFVLQPYAPLEKIPLSPVICLLLSHPEAFVFLCACILRFFVAFITTGIAANTLTPAKTHEIIPIKIIFNSWHSVNPPLMRPTPSLQIIVPQIWWIRTPEMIQKMVERTTKIWVSSVRFKRDCEKEAKHLLCKTSNGNASAPYGNPCIPQRGKSFLLRRKSERQFLRAPSLTPRYASFRGTERSRW